MNTPGPARAPDRRPIARVEAISDGVFAIAITLLVIEIKINPSEYGHLEHALVQEWPGYLAYVTSFLTIGGVWIAHHKLFSRLEFADPVMLVINLVLLMSVAFLPFPTGVLAQALNAPAEAQHTAVVFYGASVVAVELMLGFLEHYAHLPRRAVVDGQSAQRESQDRRQRRRVTASTIGYAIAMVVGLVAPDLAAFVYLLIAMALLTATVLEAGARAHRLDLG
jgi:TMEM175 potassium channel family protein